MASKYTEVEKFAIGALRRASTRWGPRNLAKIRARKQRGLYACAHCSELFGPKDIAIDHIEPVIDPLEGFQGFDEYIKRMFCNVDGLQILCKPCHKSKTLKENQLRRGK